MSDKMAFVLHGVADAPYATELATLLNGIATSLNDGARFGAGAICVVVWSESGRKAGAETLIVERLPAGANNTVLCCIGEVFCPERLQERAARIIRVSGKAEADIDAVSAMVDAVAGDLVQMTKETGRRTGATPQLATRHANGTGATYRKTTFAARSATGLVATLAIVGIVGPLVVTRPQATAAPNPLPNPSAQPRHDASAETPQAALASSGDVHVAATPISMSHQPAPFAANTRVVTVPEEHAAPAPVASIERDTAKVSVPATSVAEAPPAALIDAVQTESTAAPQAVFTAAAYVAADVTALDDFQFGPWRSNNAGQMSSTSSISAILDGRVTLSLHADDEVWGLDSGTGR